MDLASALELGKREMVVFVGAGGKKTAMGILAETARERGLTAGYTTTVHTPPPEDTPLVIDSAPDQATPSGHGPVVAFAAERVTDPERASEKVRGYDPEVLDQAFDERWVDWLLVKADGARRREFKAPGLDEPVVPARATHVVPVASVRAVGEPLDAPTVHRPERVAAVTGTAVGEPITPRTVGTVLASAAGGLKGVPGDATVTPLLNKTDTPALWERGREALRIAIEESERIDRGLVASLENGEIEVVSEGA
jgi:probable selenium-dependent hydroxylase accessory protein YqeC